MADQEPLGKLHERLRVVITGTCNQIGCDNCGLKWEGGCSATELEEKILDIEMGASND